MPRQSLTAVARRARGPLAEEAYLRVRDQILRGILPMGTPLPRRALATSFDMSIVPVSEALQRLEREGLVESRPRVGTRVRVPTPTFIRESYIVREALETQAARLFAGKASPQERDALRRLADRVDSLLERCAERRTDATFVYEAHACHCAFHLRIAECCGCELLRDAIEQNQRLIFNWLLDVMARHARRPPHFHRDLAEVLSTVDPDTAGEAMRKHVQYGLDDVIEAIQPQFNRQWKWDDV